MVFLGWLIDSRTSVSRHRQGQDKEVLQSPPLCQEKTCWQGSCWIWKVFFKWAHPKIAGLGWQSQSSRWLPSSLHPDNESLCTMIRSFRCYALRLADVDSTAFRDGWSATLVSKRSNFTNSLCKGAVVVKANCHSQGIGKTMVKALKISAAAGCYKATLSSNLKRDRAHAFTNH